MNRYTIYCTKEQARIALGLGAPIEYELGYVNGIPYKIADEEGEPSLIIPTAEEMIGWLEEQGVLCDVFPTGDFGNDGFGMRIMKKAKRLNRFESDVINYSSRKEATLAAIDAALDYLIKTKEGKQ